MSEKWFFPSSNIPLYEDTEKNEKYYESGGIFGHWSWSKYSADAKEYSLKASDNNEGGLFVAKTGGSYYIGFIDWSGTMTTWNERINDTSQGYLPGNLNSTETTYSHKGKNTTDGYEYVGVGQLSDWTDGRPSEFLCNLPIFDKNDTNAIKAYVENGDTSGAINKDYLKIEKVLTNVYVDKSQPPNLKFTWNIDGGEPPTDYLIQIYGVAMLSSPTGLYESGQFLISEISSSGSYSTTWGLLESNIGLPDILEHFFSLERIICVFSYSNGNDAITVTINKDGSYSPTSAHIGKHYLNAQGGTGEDDGGYQDTTDNSDATDENVTVNMCDLLTSTYKVTATQLKAFGNFLWSDSLTNNIKLINNSPIENVVSVKAMPLNLAGTSTTISLGNVNSGVEGLRVENSYMKSVIGSITVPRIYNNFVDFEYSEITLFLPLIGTITNLDPKEVLGYTITLKYDFDVITGDCLAMLFNNRGGGENCIGVYKANCSIDIPLTASNRAQVQSGYLSSIVGGATSIITKNPFGLVASGLNAISREYHSKSNGCVSGVTSQGLPKNAYLTIVENATQIPSNYSKTYGRPCNLTKKLKDVKGFTVCDKNIRLTNINCTYTEKEELRNLLSSGVIF